MRTIKSIIYCKETNKLKIANTAEISIEETRSDGGMNIKGDGFECKNLKPAYGCANISPTIIEFEETQYIYNPETNNIELIE